MTAVDGPDPAETVVADVLAAWTPMTSGVADATAVVAALRDAGMLVEQGAVEWGVQGPGGTEVLSEETARGVAKVRRLHVSLVRRTVTPWVPADPTARERTADDGSETP